MKPGTISVLLCLATLLSAYDALPNDAAYANRFEGETLDTVIDHLSRMFSKRLKHDVAAVCEQRCERSRHGITSSNESRSVQQHASVASNLGSAASTNDPASENLLALRVPAFPGSYGMQAYINMSKFR
jgi:hypothetical protein